MKLISKFIVIILACGMLQACSGPGGMNKQGSGTLIGGATGALLGAQFGKGTGALFATGAGALIGALIGGQIGAGMDEQDRKLAELSSQRALEAAPTGNTVEWRNPDNGHRGSITPTSTFKNDHGQYCREYTHTVVIGGQQQKAYGKACRKPDGQWEVVN
ncbi:MULTISPECIES: RT0821/Lpp0805 family surface protein [unclassified Rickettsia]|uniref:RT0821/Lpp0805 family surface protein n=1 Tax=unclassified Rickettsia TaxID=114295 RepID=UPI0020A19186|nr:RT0821/Lpp0805 family surface protein [Rickettsia endosymbiont of Ceutorhynchus assimilis]